LFNEVIVDVLRLRILDFLPLLVLRIGYTTQESMSCKSAWTWQQPE
jgi:hypothetical protein